MELTLQRIAKKDKYTIGRLSVNGELFCDTLEDTDRGLFCDTLEDTDRGLFCDTLEDTDRGLDWGMSTRDIAYRKVKGKTAIPTGKYRIILTYSLRFKRTLPLLVGVKGFDGIRIHAGNTAEDTEGCLLVGNNKAVGRLVDSRATFDKLLALMEAADKRGERIEIIIK